MGILKMPVKIVIWAMSAFILLGHSAYAQQTGSMAIVKVNPDGSKVLPNHIPREVALGLAQKSAHAKAGQMLNLRIVLPSKDPAGLDSFIKQLYDPKSPNFHKFLTPAQFALLYGASSTDSAIVTQYLNSKGLTISKQSRNGIILTVTGPVSSVESAFKESINNYALNGKTYFAPEVNPTIPAQIVGKIDAIVGMDNVTQFKPHYQQKMMMSVVKKLQAKTAGAANGNVPLKPAFSGPDNTLIPVDITAGYNLNSVSSNGSGQTLGLYEMDGYTASDITLYENIYNLPHVPLTNVYTDGADGTAGVNALEDVLDIDLAVAVAPGLSGIIVYEVPDSTANWLDQWDKIAEDDLASTISASWGLYEAAFSYDHTIFSQLAAQGQTVFASAGDAGAYDNCTTSNTPPPCVGGVLSVDDPASDPYVTGVGISALSANGNGTYNSETASLYGGGGISSVFSIPSYQAPMAALAPQPASKVSTTMRNVPDVVLTADPSTLYQIFVTTSGCTPPGCFYEVWGSSAASPEWAAFIARVNQGRVAQGQAVIGFMNPAIYQIAQSSDYGSAFHDIVSGNNSFYPAESGYDDAVGLGSFNGLNLYNELLGPAAPAGLIATGSGGQIALTWTARAGAVSYNVKRSTTSGGPYTTISTSGAVTSANYTDSPVTNGTTYYYVISAVNAGGIEGANSSQASGTPAGLTAPTNLIATAGNAQVSLTWTASTGAVSYNVKRSTTSGGPYTTISTSGAVTTTNYTDSTAVNGTVYYYVVSAVNLGGESGNSSQVTGAPVAPPLAPTGLSAVAGNTQIGLSWSASANTVSYNIKRAGVSGGPYTTVSASGTVVGPSYTDSGLVNGTTYYYVISAVNAGGESPNSSELSSTTTVTVPVAPVSLVAAAGNATVSLTWAASAGAVSYNVKRSAANGGPYTTISTGGAVTTANYTDSTVVNGSTYYYVVSAVNAGGEGANSLQVSASPLAPPLAPTGLIATAGISQVALTWSASATAASYNVKRATVSGGPYTTISTSGAVTTTNYTDISGINGTTYYYVVSAVNVGGESPNSAQVGAIPRAPVASPTNLNFTILGARIANRIVEGGVVLTWVQSSTAGVVQNKIYRSTGVGAYSLLAVVSPSTTYTDKNMTKGTTYNYRVTAFTSLGFESLPSNSVPVNY
jgi:fibronectin type 3 domain-containing protein